MIDNQRPTSLKSGSCPACGSRDIYFKERNKSGDRVNQIPVSRGWTVQYAALDNYACATCGYLELYVSEPENRAKIRENWEPFDPRKS